MTQDTSTSTAEAPETSTLPSKLEDLRIEATLRWMRDRLAEELATTPATVARVGDSYVYTFKKLPEQETEH